MEASDFQPGTLMRVLLEEHMHDRGHMNVTFPLRDCIRGCGRRFYPPTITARVCDVCMMRWMLSICPDCGYDEEDDPSHAPDCGKVASA